MNLIFHITDGPHYHPNRVYKAHVLRPADAAGFFRVREVGTDVEQTVTEANIRLFWADQPAEPERRIIVDAVNPC